MNLLAFDTSTSACSIAIQTNTGNIIQSHEIGPMQQARQVLPVIQQLLQTAKLTTDDLDAIIYGCGPGSFTGIRIATSVAQGLAFALNKPVVPISSLNAIAQSAHAEQKLNNILIAVDARMDEIYWAIYQANAAGIMELQGQEQVCKPDQIHLPMQTDWHAAGDGWTKYHAELVTRLGFTPQAVYPDILPNAKSLLLLAQDKLAKGQTVSAAEAAPVYLR